MTIVPVYPGIVEYFSPGVLQSFVPFYHRNFYPQIHMHPIVHHHVEFPSLTYYTHPLTYMEPSSDYKIINAMHNPGNYWRWPQGQ